MRAATPPITMLFDADCGLCTHAAAWAVRRTGARGIRAIALQQVPEHAELATATGGRDLAASLHVVDAAGSVRTGAAAVLAVARQVPRWRHIAALADNGVGRALLEPAYRAVAANRTRVGRLLGVDQACAVPGADTRR